MFNAKNITAASLVLLLLGGGYAIFSLDHQGGREDSQRIVDDNVRAERSGKPKSGQTHQLRGSSLEDRVGLTNSYLINLRFPDDAKMLQARLEDELEFILSFPDEEDRDQLLSRLARTFGEQFFSSKYDESALITAVDVYECVLLSFGDRVKSDSPAYGGLLAVIPLLADKVPELTPKREEMLVLEYQKGKSELFGKVAGTLTANRLKSKGIDGLRDLRNLGKDEIRLQAERLMLIDMVNSDNSKHDAAYSYYFGSDCYLGPEWPFVVKLISSSFATHPEEVSNIVFESAPSLKRDSALVQMVLRMHKDDPEAAGAWINEISDPSLREYAEEKFQKEKPLVLQSFREPTHVPKPVVEAKESAR